MQRSSKPAIKAPIILTVIGLLGYVAKLALNIFLARHLAPSVYGDFMLALKTFVLVASIMLLGTPTAAKRFLSLYLRRRDNVNAKKYISWSMRLWLKSSGVVIISMLCIYLLIAVFHWLGIKPLSSYHFTLYVLIFTPIGAFSLLITSFLQCANKVYLSSFLSKVARSALMFTLLATTVYLLHVKPSGVLQLWFILFTVYLMLSLSGYIFSWRYLPSLSASEHSSDDESKRWLSTSIKFISGQVIFLVVTVLDMYLIEIIVANEHKLGHYAAVWTIASVLSTLSASIYRFITPKASYYLAEGKQEKLQKKINQGLGFAFIMMTTLLVLSCVYGRELLAIFGPAFTGDVTYRTLLISLIANYLIVFNQVPFILLSNSGNERWLIIGGITELSILLIVGAILTYSLGILGTAISTLFGIAAKTSLYLVISKQKTGLKPLGFV